VASVTAISTTAIGGVEADLPGPDPAYLEHAAAAGTPDWSDTDAIADMVTAEAGQLAGSRHPHDAAAARAMVTLDLARADRPESLVNHTLVAGGEQWRDRLGELAVQLLVIHGTADPLFPVAHGEALAKLVPGATLVTIDGGGHELHEADWDQILNAISTHTAR
jgi:pimeloyl-ACP methyl ester carboxylesterase